MKTSLAALLALITFNACATDPERSIDPLLSELVMLTGPSAERCGPVLLGKDPTQAWNCAQAADQRGTPYWFALQLQGIDSDVWLASLRTPSGQRFILSYDSNFMGGAGLLPRFVREACNGTVVFRPGSKAALQCARK
jgi:hypothetical protein